jgi:hypothetical protein
MPIQFCAPDGICDLEQLANGNNGFVLQGVAAGDYSGYSVSGAGDINGDGFSDMIIGAFHASPRSLSDFSLSHPQKPQAKTVF